MPDISERTLDRLIRIGIAIVVVAVGFEAVNFVLDRLNESPTLVEREVSAAEKAVREEPNEIGPRLALAEVYRVADQPDDALEQYDEVLNLEGSQSTALLGRAEVLAELGKSSEAAKSFKKLIKGAGTEAFAEVDPRLEAAYYGYGSALLDLGQAKKALKMLKRAAAIESGDADVWNVLGEAAVQAGSPGLAVNAFRQAVMFVPTGWCEPYEGLAKAYRKLHRKPYAQYATAMVDLCEERLEDATRRLKPLVSGPARVDAMLGLGMIAELESNRAAATRWYRKVLAVDGENFNARNGIGRLTAPQSGAPPAGHPSTGGA
jgi:tetratricopeptide (TPR) repeat protein